MNLYFSSRLKNVWRQNWLDIFLEIVLQRCDSTSGEMWYFPMNYFWYWSESENSSTYTNFERFIVFQWLCINNRYKQRISYIYASEADIKDLKVFTRAEEAALWAFAVEKTRILLSRKYVEPPSTNTAIILGFASTTNEKYYFYAQALCI